jgi:mono/diheme cytochrome c family protein/glucose/arabinose dehydrogenase
MKFMRWSRSLPAVCAVALLFGGSLSAAEPADVAAETKAAVARGELPYLANCSMCHGVTGVGVKGTYPPLAASDWLAANRTEAIRAVVSGLKDDITVNGEAYSGQMPAIIIPDGEVADLLTYVFNTWGNPGGRVTPADVQAVRAKTKFKTYAELKAAGDFRPLPPAPAGFTVRELARLPDFATRLASDGRGGPLFVLSQYGTVWRFDVATGIFKSIVSPKELGSQKPGDIETLGLLLDPQGRLWISVNHRINAKPLVLNEVTIFRTSAVDDAGSPVAPRVWLRTTYPYGVGSFNHGISHLGLGPDGRLYVSSGSRTDSGEEGGAPNFGKMGEVDITGTIWRLDPNAAEPKIEVIARGIRNAFSFAWDPSGNMFALSNGPDAHTAEEMEFIVPPRAGEVPRHHGFPYQFADAPAGKKWYPHTPAAPPGLTFVPPVVNLGPAGTLGREPMSTFTPHSSPTGLVWLGAEWPAAARNSFLVGRFGNFVPGADGGDAGFDLLSLKMERRPDGSWATRTTTFLAPLARPIDVHLAGPGKIYVLEYTRVTDFKSQLGRLPGRILEVAAQPTNR